MAFMAAAIPFIQAGASILGGISALGGLMGNKKESTPKPLPVTVMPDPDAQKVAQARRRSLADQQRRQGRESTILADAADEKLGG